MILSAVYVLVVAQSSSEVPEGLINNPVPHHSIYNKHVMDSPYISMRTFYVLYFRNMRAFYVLFLSQFLPFAVLITSLSHF